MAAAQTITIDIVINSRNNTATGMNGARNAMDRVSQSAQSARRELNRLGNTNANPRVSVVDRASSTISKIGRGLASIGGKTVKAGVKILDYATRPLRTITNALFSIKGLIVGIGSAWAANQLISNPLSVADAYSSAKIGFSNLLGESEGQAMMDKLDEFAKKTPFNTSGVISNAQMMMAMGWDAKDIIKDMETIGNAAAATGKGTQGLEAIVRALSQIKTKGKLSTEELNQLSEQGIAAKAMLAEQLGYGTGDSGIAAMSADLEKGLIGSETAIKALLEGMKQFDGMMDKTANETVEGLKSQIEDAFEINVVRKWGQGLQDGAKRGLGKVLELLDKSEDSLEKVGDFVYKIGKELSNWAADKLEQTIDKILEVTESDAFKNASLFGKAKILWDEIIAEPFSKWWDSKGKPFFVEKANSMGKLLGEGMSNAITGLFDAITNILNDDSPKLSKNSKTIGGAFADGFAEGFRGKDIWNSIISAAGAAFKRGFKEMFTNGPVGWAIATALAIKVASGISQGINMAQTIWYGTGATTAAGTQTLAGMGLRGAIGSTGNYMFSGGGILGSLATVGYNSTRYANAGLLGRAGLTIPTGSALSGGWAAAAGAATSLGAIGTIAGTMNTISDLTETLSADSKNDRTMYGTRAATKAGMIGTGAAIGTLIAPGLGTAIGAGLGGLATFLAGNKLADAISGVSKSTAELNEEAEELADKRLAERFGEVTLSAEELQERVREVFGSANRDRIDRFKQSMKDLKTVSDTVMNYQSDIGYAHERIMGKETLSESDVAAYKEALEGYAGSVKQLLTTNKTATTSAFHVLFGDDAKGMANMTKTMNNTYSKLERELAEKSTKLNEVIAAAFNDGVIDIDEEKKINEIVKQIEAIQDKIEQRMQKEKEAQSAASYDLLEKKYGGDSDLSAESFKELISETQAQSEADQKTYDEAYVKGKAEIDVELELDEIKDKEYKEKLEALEKKWLEGKSTTIERSVNVSFNVLTDKYGKELKRIEKVKEIESKGFNDSDLNTLSESSRNTTLENNYKRWGTYSGYEINWTDKTAQEFESYKDSWLQGRNIDLATQKEMKQWYEALKPQEEDLMDLKASYEKLGEDVPQWINDSLAEIENVKLASGNMDSFYKLVGEQLALDDEEYARAMIKAKEQGQDIPQALIDGINEGLNGKEVEVKGIKITADKKNIYTGDLDNTVKDVVQKLQDKGILKVTKDGKVTVKTKNGKIDTTGLDLDTKKAIKKLEKDGTITVNKDGTVTFNAKKVDTKKLDEATANALNSLEDSGYFEVDKSGKVTITADGGIDYDEIKDEKIKEKLEKLEEAGVIEIDKTGNVTVKAGTVDTSAAKTEAETKTKSDVGAPVSFDKPAYVKALESGTETSEAKISADEKTKIDVGAPTNVEKDTYVKAVEKGTDSSTARTSADGKIKTNMGRPFNANSSVNVNVGLGIVSGIAGIVSSITSKVTSSIKKIDANVGGGSKRQFATGGYVDKPIVSLVGEAGPEMIIPLSANRRKRGKYLWERAGRAMGLFSGSGDEKVYMNANGGLYGLGASRIGNMMNNAASNTEEVQSSGRSGTVKVDVGGIQIHISGGNGVKEDIMNNMDAISEQIALAIENAFQNMPLAIE